MPENVGTKERIARAALALFARKGYGAVSIRDICGAVSVKESTIYYYYENKRAILDELIGRIEGLVEDMKRAFDRAFELTDEVTDEAMAAVAVGVLDDYLMNPYVRSMIAVLTIERMSDESARREYERLVFKLPLEQQEKVFAAMMARGFISSGDARALAEEYYSVIYAAFQRHCLGEGECRAAVAREQIRRGVLDLYGKMKEGAL